MNTVLQSLAERWWVPLFRGLAAIAFGVLTLLVPGSSLFALVLLYGAYALADGAVSVVYAIGEHKNLPGWGWTLVGGLVSMAAGVATFVTPGITGLMLLFLIGVSSVVGGAMQIGAAIAWRKELKGEFWLVLAGLLSIVFGVGVLVFPGAGALSVAWLIAAYAVALGVMQVVVSVRLYRLGHPRGASALQTANPVA